MAFNDFIFHHLQIILTLLTVILFQCHYHFSCGVDFAILLELEQLVKLYSYPYGYCSR